VKPRSTIAAALLWATLSSLSAEPDPPKTAADERLEHWVQMAELQLAAEKQFQTKSKHFIVTTDSKTPETAPRIAGNLEATYATLHRLLGTIVRSRSGQPPIHVYVFQHRGRFESLRKQIGVAEFADGFYAPPGFMAFSLQHPVVEELLAIMIHETVHAYLDRNVFPRGSRPPVWINEGFATYIGNAEIYKGDLVLGSHERMMNYHMHGAIARARSPWMQTVDAVRAAIKKKAAIPVADLLKASYATFKGPDHKLYYQESCLLVQLLSEGGDDWPERFSRLMKRVTAGEPSVDAIRAIYGLDADALEREFRDFVKRF
jgi:hypothetical protein